MRLLVAAVSVLVLAIAASSAHATFSGVSGQIAYSECSGDTCPIVQLFITNPDGSGNHMLVQQPPGDVFDDPEFAPDGRSVAFMQCENGAPGSTAASPWCGPTARASITSPRSPRA